MAASLDSAMVQWLLGGLILSLASRNTTATFICCKHMWWIILGSLFSCLTPILKIVLQFSLGWGHLASTNGHTIGLSVSTNKNPLCLKMCFCTGSNLNLDTAEEPSVFLAILSRLNEADLFPLTGAGHDIGPHTKYHQRTMMAISLFLQFNMSRVCNRVLFQMEF